jgi:hypothetical protein
MKTPLEAFREIRSICEEGGRTSGNMLDMIHSIADEQVWEMIDKRNVKTKSRES